MVVAEYNYCVGGCYEYFYFARNLPAATFYFARFLPAAPAKTKL